MGFLLAHIHEEGNMTGREKRLIAFLGAHLRLTVTKSYYDANPKLIDALVLELDKAKEKLTTRDWKLIHAATFAARDAAYDQVIAWNTVEGVRAKRDRIIRTKKGQ